jgi:DNA-directed RNA polymerase specialized sigma24 family protein
MPHESDYLDLDICLTRLERTDPRKAQIIELRFFGGLELHEIAETVNLSVSMVKKELTLAKLSIYQEMRDGRRAPAE